MTIKVLFDYSIFSNQKFGGISRYFVELMKHLPEGRIRTKVCAPVYINEYLSSIRSQHRWGFKVPEIRRTGVFRNCANVATWPMAELLFRPDVIHETYYRKPSLRTSRAKTCITVYDLIHERFAHMISDSERALFEKNLRIKKESIERADLIFCISETTRKDLEKFYGIAKEKTVVTLLSANAEVFKRAHHNATTSPARPYVLFVNSRGWYKNFETVLKAFELDKKISNEFDLLCFGGGGFSSHELASIDRAGLTGKVHFRTGSDSLLAAAYHNASAFVFPSLYEGFGIPLLEAMWADCPVVAGRTDCLVEVADTAAEYFDPTSAEDLARALGDVCFSVERRKELIAQGQMRRTRFSWSQTAHQTLAGYEMLSK